MAQWKVDNFSGIVKDIGAGKQPANTLNDSRNFGLQRKSGSLTSRYGYAAGLTAPSGMVSLDEHLCLSVTTPAAIDQHIWFGQDVTPAKHVWANPFYHLSDTAQTQNNGWVDINESKTVVITQNATVTGDTTNTIALTGADTCTALGLSTTANYYKNWVIAFKPSGSDTITLWHIGGYTVASDLATFTLDNVIDEATGLNVTAARLKTASFVIWRYFHSDRNSSSALFAPSYTSPAGYSTDLAVRFSGGSGSTVGYKNIKLGYINKTFFPSVTNRTRAMQGSYCDQAECFAPASTLLKSATLNSISSTNLIKSPTLNSYFVESTTNWTAVGSNHTQSYGWGEGHYRLWFQFLASGDIDSNHILLSGTSYLETLSTGNTYTLKLRYWHMMDSFPIKIAIGTSVYTVSLDGSAGMAAGENFIKDVSLDFTVGTSGKPDIKIWSEFAMPNTVVIEGIALTLKSSLTMDLDVKKTYRVYASYVYDGFQESELTYLSGSYVAQEFATYDIILSQGFGALNKFATAIRLYCSKDDGDTTIGSNTTRDSAVYLVANIPLSSATTGWSFNATTGKYEYTKSITENDFKLSEGTWEQKTGRVASASTTCSYSIAAPIAGRIMLAQDYDYSDARAYTNRIRYTGFSGSGVMCPDIFPNLGDTNISDLGQGTGTDIKAIADYDGNCVVWKDASMLLITTSETVSLWRTEIISDSIGATNKYVPKKLGRSLYWSDAKDVYRWNGGEIVSLGRGVFRDYYQSIYVATQRAWVDRSDGSYNLALSLGGTTKTLWFKIDPQSPLPTIHQLGTNIILWTVAQTRAGVIYFTTSISTTYTNNKFSLDTDDSTAAIPMSFDTGWITPEARAFIQLEEIWFDVELAGTLSAITIALQIDDTAISFVTAPTVTTSTKYHRVKVPPSRPGHRFKITWACSSTGTLVINRVGAVYSIIGEYGDMR